VGLTIYFQQCAAHEDLRREVGYPERFCPVFYSFGKRMR
jgi:hypothetical protein